MPSNDKRWIVTRQADLAQFFDVSPYTIKDWVKAGMPGKAGAYNLSAIAAWRLERAKKNAGTGEIDEMMVGDSPELERYRAARADEVEIKVAKLREQLIDSEKAREVLGRIAERIRRAGELLDRRYGPDALELLNRIVGEPGLTDDLGTTAPADDGAD